MFDEEDKQLIQEFGLQTFDETAQRGLLQQYYATRDLRISMALEDKLTDEQLDEFEKLHEAGDDAATMQWLRTAVNDYDQVVSDETAALKADLKRSMANLGRSTDQQ